MSTAVATAVEIMTFTPESKRALTLFAALEAVAGRCGLDVTRTDVYSGSAPWLLLWGPGAPSRAAVLERHVAAGGRAIALDLAYWDRFRKFRVSFDAAHPAAWVMRKPYSADRFLSDHVPVADAWKRNGPVVVAGLGDKARVQYGADVVDAWERSMIRECRERWPGRPVVYRKKKAHQTQPDGVGVSSFTIPIDLALRGASLVVTWHSNVAVDAIRLGIPVVCRDGAAAAVFPPTLGAEDPRPLLPAVRDQFLANLAHFQWAPTEAVGFWTFIAEQLS